MRRIRWPRHSESVNHDAGVLIVAGEIALAKKDFAQASAYFEQAAQRNPDSAAIRTELGISRLAQGDSRAMADLQTAAAMEGAGSRADTFIILNQLQHKQFDAALASIAALEKKQGANPLTWNYRGASYLGKQDTVHARDSFEQALKLDPKFFPAAANLAQLDLQDNQPAAARQRFEGILKADPRHLNAMLALADLGLRNHDEKTYVSWLEKAATSASAGTATAGGAGALPVGQGRTRTRHLPWRARPSTHSPTTRQHTTSSAPPNWRWEIPPTRWSASAKWSSASPARPLRLIKLATTQIVAKDLDGARKTLQDALRIQPDFLDAQLMLGRRRDPERAF